MNYNKVAEIKFKAEIVYEYSMLPVPVSQGMADNEMVLYVSEDGTSGSIDWDVNYEHGDGESVGIGLEIDGKKIVGYDGVFELPKEAEKLLTDNGYDLSEL